MIYNPDFMKVLLYSYVAIIMASDNRKSEIKYADMSEDMQ